MLMQDAVARNTLGLDDDMDDVHLIEDIEASFGVDFGSETENWLTVADLYDSLKSRLDGRSETYPGCITATAFRRIRSSLAAIGQATPITPRTKLSELRIASIRALYRRLRKNHGLRTPSPIMTWIGVTGLFLIALGIISFVFLQILPAHRIWWHLVPIAIGWVLIQIDPCDLPKDIETVGDLTKRIAALNANSFTGNTRALRQSEIWANLVEILAEHGDLAMANIRPDTYLLANQLK